jgi:hypothetical protein
MPPLDTKFRLLGFRVRIHATFWLLHICGAWGTATQPDADPTGLSVATLFALSLLCTLGSVLLHESAHAIVGRALGASGEIELTPLAGITGTELHARTRGRTILILLAGPLATLTISAVSGAAYLAVRPSDEEVRRAAVEREAAALNNPGRLPPAPPPPPRQAAAEHVLLVLFLFNAAIFLFNVLPNPITDVGRIITVFEGGYPTWDGPNGAGGKGKRTAG